MTILKTENLKKHYCTNGIVVKALDGIDFAIAKGEFVAIIGTSGSGKTTFLNMIGGLDRPTSGTVEVGGTVLSTLTDEQLTLYRRRKVGFVFQHYNLVPILTAKENIALPINLDGKDVDEVLLNDVLEVLDVKDKIHAMPNQLSGGQKQRIAIARAMISKPSIILADEPTGNLDSKTGQDVLGLLKKTAKRYEQTIIMITHNDEVAQLADRIIQIEDGKLKRV